MNNKDMPAFPVECSYNEDGSTPRGVQTTNYSGWEKGFSKRELISATISIDQKEEILCFSAAGIKEILGRDLSTSLMQKLRDFAEVEAKIRVMKADALLTELSKSENDLP